MKAIRKTVECLKCGYEWLTRVEHPKKCPFCQSRDWRKP